MGVHVLRRRLGESDTPTKGTHKSGELVLDMPVKGTNFHGRSMRSRPLYDNDLCAVFATKSSWYLSSVHSYVLLVDELGPTMKTFALPHSTGVAQPGLEAPVGNLKIPISNVSVQVTFIEGSARSRPCMIPDRISRQPIRYASVRLPDLSAQVRSASDKQVARESRSTTFDHSIVSWKSLLLTAVR